MLAKVLTDHSDTVLILTEDDYNKRLEAARQETEDALIGTRWGVDDCLHRLNGYRRADFINHVLMPKRQELEQCGALLHWANGRGDRYRFRATAMAKWMEANLEQIDKGGWTE